MKVIKHGNTIKELTCSKCGCIFAAADTDIRLVGHEEVWYDYNNTSSTAETPYFAQYGPKLRSRCYVDKFILCPECGKELNG